MGNTKLVVKSWRRRQYFFASASVFKQIAEELKLWVEPTLENGEIDEKERKQRVKALFKVTDYKETFQLVGDALVEFVRTKTSPFPGSTSCQESFRAVAAWKRALIYINLVRYVTGLPANNHWHKYGYHHYKENSKMMDTYCLRDEEILNTSTKFKELPQKVATSENTPTKKSKKRRTRDKFELSSPEMKKQKMKITCTFSSSSDSDDSDE